MRTCKCARACVLWVNVQAGVVRACVCAGGRTGTCAGRFGTHDRIDESRPSASIFMATAGIGMPTSIILKYLANAGSFLHVIPEDSGAAAAAGGASGAAAAGVGGRGAVAAGAAGVIGAAGAAGAAGAVGADAAGAAGAGTSAAALVAFLEAGAALAMTTWSGVTVVETYSSAVTPSKPPMESNLGVAPRRGSGQGAR